MSPNIINPSIAPANICIYCVGANKDEGKCLAELIIKINATPLITPLVKFKIKSFRFIEIKFVDKKIPEKIIKNNFP